MIKHKLFTGIILLVFLYTQSQEILSQRPNETLPIIEMSQRCLIGGVQNKKWLKTEEAFGKKYDGTKKFRLYTIDGVQSEITMSKIEKGDDKEPCSEFWFAETASEITKAIAITTPRWNIVPRVPIATNLTDKTYMKIVEDILKNKGIKKPVVRITQAYKIDLEGDGTEELVIAANSEGMGDSAVAKAGDYSVLFLRKIIDGKVKTIMIAEEYHTKEAGGLTPSDNNISSIADLNGDGIMEIVIYGGYYEGSGSTVYEIKENKATSVLECGCGS